MLAFISLKVFPAYTEINVSNDLMLVVMLLVDNLDAITIHRSLIVLFCVVVRGVLRKIH